MLWILNRRKVELAGIGQAQHVVLQIQSIRFALQVVRKVPLSIQPRNRAHLIVRENVFAIFVSCGKVSLW